MSTPSARILHLGLDVHKESVISAVLADTALTPRRPGHQRKHNRYDAKELAHFYRSGDLVLIAIPTEAEERTRDLVRCRTTFQRQLHRARQFVLKFCTRRGLR